MLEDKNVVFKCTKLLLISIGLLIFYGCKTPLKTKNEIFSYINDERNGLVKSNQSNGIECKINFLPWQIQVLNKQKSYAVLDERTKAAFKSKYYFLINYSKEGKELLRQLNPSEYSEMVQVLAFRMTEYVKIKFSNGKIIEPLSCLFQQTYGLSKSNQLLVIFDAADFKNKKAFTILINEFGLRTGDVSFSFSLDEQQKLQHLLLS